MSKLNSKAIASVLDCPAYERCNRLIIELEQENEELRQKVSDAEWLFLNADRVRDTMWQWIGAVLGPDSECGGAWAPDYWKGIRAAREAGS